MICKNNVYCDVAQFNRVLKACKEKGYIIKDRFQKQDPERPLGYYAFLDIQRTKVTLTTKMLDKKITVYHVRLDEEDCVEYTNGGEAYKILKQYVRNLPDLREDEYYKDFLEENQDISKIGTIAAVASYNPKYDNMRIENCFGYDLNSAWPYFMKSDMPDTSVKPRIYEKVGDNEIGFVADDNSQWRLCRKGEWAMFIFPLIESPFKRFVDVWYAKKKNAKNKAEKNKAKGILNFSIGYLQKVNPFIRATIICRANEYINSLIYENGKLRDDVLYWNTDSIVCTHELPDLKIGEELGEWKLQYSGSFALKKSVYQWNYGIPTHRGVSKGWYKKKYPNGVDILKDKIPSSRDNIYIITDDFRIVKREDYEEN